jgi:hypothetical protein
LPTPTPDPDRTAAAAALAAFDSLIEQTDLAYHVKQVGHVEAAAQGGTAMFDYTAAIDVAGADFSAAFTIRSVVTQIRAVKGKVWTKDGGKPWVLQFGTDLPRPSELVSPWQYLGDLGKLAFVARAMDREGAFEFENTGPVSALTALTNSLGIVGYITALIFVVQPDGTPVEIRFEGKTPVGDGAVKSTGVLSISNMGGAIVIKPPA